MIVEVENCKLNLSPCIKPYARCVVGKIYLIFLPNRLLIIKHLQKNKAKGLIFRFASYDYLIVHQFFSIYALKTLIIFFGYDIIEFVHIKSAVF